jgi:hypothetical protein
MSWADKVMETALAALAERTASAGRIPADAPWSWNPRDVWLTRLKQPEALSARSSMRAQSNVSLNQPPAIPN